MQTTSAGGPFRRASLFAPPRASVPGILILSALILAVLMLTILAVNPAIKYANSMYLATEGSCILNYESFDRVISQPRVPGEENPQTAWEVGNAPLLLAPGRAEECHSPGIQAGSVYYTPGGQQVTAESDGVLIRRVDNSAWRDDLMGFIPYRVLAAEPWCYYREEFFHEVTEPASGKVFQLIGQDGACAHGSLVESKLYETPGGQLIPAAGPGILRYEVSRQGWNPPALYLKALGGWLHPHMLVIGLLLLTPILLAKAAAWALSPAALRKMFPGALLSGAAGLGIFAFFSLLIPAGTDGSRFALLEQGINPIAAKALAEPYIYPALAMAAHILLAGLSRLITTLNVQRPSAGAGLPRSPKRGA